MEVAQLCLTLCYPVDYTVHGILQARILEWVTFPFSRGSSQPRGWTQVSHIAGRFFTSSLSLLQRIFLTQELNQGLLHCRWIFYQLNYEGRGLFFLRSTAYFIYKSCWICDLEGLDVLFGLNSCFSAESLVMKGCLQQGNLQEVVLLVYNGNTFQMSKIAHFCDCRGPQDQALL